MTTRSALAKMIAAFFPQASMANPTNSDLYTVLSRLAPAPAAVTATADGLTTGLVSADSDWLDITSANANNIITLPALSEVSNGKVIRGWVGANGCEIRTPAASTEKINGVNSDGTNEAAIPATTLIELTKVSDADGWVLTAATELGAVATAIVPD